MSCLDSVPFHSSHFETGDFGGKPEEVEKAVEISMVASSYTNHVDRSPMEDQVREVMWCDVSTPTLYRTFNLISELGWDRKVWDDWKPG